MAWVCALTAGFGANRTLLVLVIEYGEEEHYAYIRVLLMLRVDVLGRFGVPLILSCNGLDIVVG